MTLLQEAFLAGFVALVITFLATPLVIRFAYFINIIDDPKKDTHPKKIHKYPTPRGGGIGIYAGILISAILFLPIDNHISAILFGATLIVILGLLDDKYNINPYLRLIAQFMIVSIPIISGIGISFLSNPLGAEVIDLSHPQIDLYLLGEPRSVWLLADLFAMIWIVFMMNMLNMGAKGVDGQLPGVAAVASFTIAALSLKFSADITQWPIIILAMITGGAYLGFLPWNFYPQKIMPAYSGSTLAGYMLAILSILSTTKVGTLIVALGIPLADTGYSIVRRISRGKSPFWGDREHLHHRLLDLGFSKRQVALTYWIGTGLLGVLALNLNSSFKLYTIVGVIALIGGILIWITHRLR